MEDRGTPPEERANWRQLPGLCPLLRRLSVLGTTVAVVLGLLALGDAPQQLQTWKRWIDAVTGLTVDWAAFWSGDAGRWVLVLAAIATGFWAWDVPNRLRPRKWWATGGAWENDAARRELCAEKQPSYADLARDHRSAAADRDALRKALEETQQDRERIRGLLAKLSSPFGTAFGSLRSRGSSGSLSEHE